MCVRVIELVSTGGTTEPSAAALNRPKHASHSDLLIQRYNFIPLWWNWQKLQPGFLLTFIDHPHIHKREKNQLTFMSAFWYAEPSQGLWISVQAVWVEGNDLRAFQNIPMAGFGAKALAPVGESLERCFRAQLWCYHIVSGLNGLPTVCLKGSHNDRDHW